MTTPTNPVTTQLEEDLRSAAFVHLKYEMHGESAKIDLTGLSSSYGDLIRIDWKPQLVVTKRNPSEPDRVITIPFEDVVAIEVDAVGSPADDPRYDDQWWIPLVRWLRHPISGLLRFVPQK